MKLSCSPRLLQMSNIVLNQLTLCPSSELRYGQKFGSILGTTLHCLIKPPFHIVYIITRESVRFSDSGKPIFGRSILVISRLIFVFIDLQELTFLVLFFLVLNDLPGSSFEFLLGLMHLLVFFLYSRILFSFLLNQFPFLFNLLLELLKRFFEELLLLRRYVHLVYRGL